MVHRYAIGELLLIKHWDTTGAPILEQPPALVIDRYVSRPAVYPDDEASAHLPAHEYIIQSKQQLVYDVLFSGVLEVSISENWLSALVEPPHRVNEG
jgi:hypothetical protein